MKKDSARDITPEAEVVCVHAPLVPPGSPQANQLHHLHAQLSLGQSCHRQKVLHLCMQGRFGRVRLCDPIHSGLPGFSVRERVLQAKILECSGQYWLPYTSRALYFLLPWLPTPLSTWCFQKPCNPSSCTTSTCDPHKGKPKSSRAASGATADNSPSGQPT